MGSESEEELRGSERDPPDSGGIVVADSMCGTHRFLDELRGEGFFVCHVETVRSAVEAMEALRPALLVTELRLGDGSGFDLVRESSRFQVDVLIATAYGSIESAYAAISAGALDYLTKPVSAQQVLASWRQQRHNAEKPVWPSLKDTRREYIREMLGQYASIARTAQVLHLDRRSLRRMMSRLQLRKASRC